MIQRIQSVWLLLASAAAFLTLELPFYIGTNNAGIPSYKLNGMENIYMLALTAFIGMLAFINIFIFRNRKLQIRLSLFTIILELLLIFFYYTEVKTFDEGSGTYALSALLHSCVIFFLYFAMRGISKDAKVIRDSNRLR